MIQFELSGESDNSLSYWISIDDVFGHRTTWYDPIELNREMLKYCNKQQQQQIK